MLYLFVIQSLDNRESSKYSDRIPFFIMQISLKNLVVEVGSTGVLVNGRPLKLPAQIDRLAISSLGQYYSIAGLGGEDILQCDFN